MWMNAREEALKITMSVLFDGCFFRVSENETHSRDTVGDGVDVFLAADILQQLGLIFRKLSHNTYPFLLLFKQVSVFALLLTCLYKSSFISKFV